MLSGTLRRLFGRSAAEELEHIEEQARIAEREEGRDYPDWFR